MCLKNHVRHHNILSFQLHPLRDFVHRFTFCCSPTGICVFDCMDDYESARTKKLEGAIIVVCIQLVNDVDAYGSGRQLHDNCGTQKKSIFIVRQCEVRRELKSFNR